MLPTMIQATQSTMKAIALDRFGGLETMKLQTLPVPEVGPNEVLIHVEWAGVGKWDPFEREGGFAREFGIKPKFPYVLGSDGARTRPKNGKINPGKVFDLTLPLDQVAEGYRAMDERRAIKTFSGL